ncbi:hypothetical protein GUJ93_ZPchr0004g38624 [Zizania palustris]|uniref:Uncharacterized protein n=1 Tax=Zizania palustris TaxID=103762 RepID=A0A8J5VNK0_ZIZPA|nr:hypothetical protein GUJ93_ZPchr0004g38624 [Zizania palustris]
MSVDILARWFKAFYYDFISDPESEAIFLACISPCLLPINFMPYLVAALDQLADDLDHAQPTLTIRDTMDFVIGADTPEVIIADPDMLADASIIITPARASMSEGVPVVIETITEVPLDDGSHRGRFTQPSGGYGGGRYRCLYYRRCRTVSYPC